MDRYFEVIALFMLIITTIFAYAQTTNLDIKADTMLQFDDILLIITIPIVFVDLIFSLMPAFNNHAVLQLLIAILRVFDVIIQTAFIIDGQRRYINRKWLQNKKPGRQLIIFLAIGI